MNFETVVEQVRQYGGNPWTQFAAVDHGWEAIMFQANISDRQFLMLGGLFPDMPPDPVLVAELARRGIWLDDHDPTPEQLPVTDTPQPEAVQEQPLSDERRRQRDKALRSVQRADELADRKRSRRR
ncbi:hypothetical protein [Ruegeria atlantica]|uniref:hypothetical protein n=1 Tax=Ruegeria atlantica TaxID=81569 RepID=UPI002494B936|nr:hypothetical protein [Ruegeria atlantica]